VVCAETRREYTVALCSVACDRIKKVFHHMPMLNFFPESWGRCVGGGGWAS